MLNNLVIGSYYPIKSRVHLMNPVSKVICTILFIVMVFLCNDIRLMILLSFMSILLFELAHLPRKIYLRTLLNLKYLLLFIILIYYLIGADIETVINMCLRLYIIVLYTTILTLTTTPNNLTEGLKTIMTPFRLIGLPVNKLALSLSLALRFIPTIIDQGNKIMKSQASRGIDYYASNIKGKLLAIKSMLIPMFILTIRRADNLAEAMEVRLYDINAKRTSLHKNDWTLFDTSFVFMHFLILSLIVIRMVIL